MKHLRQIINEGIVYGDSGSTDVTKPGGYSKYRSNKGYDGPRIDDMDPHKPYETHLNNVHHLQFIHNNSKDAREKHQANKEIQFGTKKMDFWKKHPKFDRAKAEEIHKRVKKKWNIK